MPVRLSSTAVLAWPDPTIVAEAARRWAEDLRRAEAGVAAVGYFGSYARGDWGVGSDLDGVVIVDDSPEPFERRAVRWDATRLPVPAAQARDRGAGQPAGGEAPLGWSEPRCGCVGCGDRSWHSQVGVS